MVKLTWLGLLFGFGSIILGNLFDGGNTASLIQFTAFLIVIGGTLGAVLVSHSQEAILMAIKLCKYAFHKNKPRLSYRRQFVELAKLIRKDGRIALEKEIQRQNDLWLNEALRLVIDGLSPVDIRSAFEIKLAALDHQLQRSIKVLQDAGGFAPTMGILGAVLGLIHVMTHLTDTAKLGPGIAIAFVATIYGVGFANLIFIPIANKLKWIVADIIEEKRAIIEGACLLAAEAHSLIVDVKLSSFEQLQGSI